MLNLLSENFSLYGRLYQAGAVVLLFLFLVHFFLRRQRPLKKSTAKLSMYSYKMIYTDQKDLDKQEGVDYSILLYSARYDLQGKPDYIFKHRIRNSIVPVEIKSGEIGKSAHPHQGDMLQLAAYFLIIEDVYGIKPKFGKLIYSDYMFQIKNTAKIRKLLLQTLKRMRAMLESGEEEANPSFTHCRYCVCNGTVCEYCKNKSSRKG